MIMVGYVNTALSMMDRSIQTGIHLRDKKKKKKKSIFSDQNGVKLEISIRKKLENS